jgi:hypothetical protein
MGAPTAKIETYVVTSPLKVNISFFFFIIQVKVHTQTHKMTQINK